MCKAPSACLLSACPTSPRAIFRDYIKNNLWLIPHLALTLCSIIAAASKQMLSWETRYMCWETTPLCARQSVNMNGHTEAMYLTRSQRDIPEQASCTQSTCWIRGSRIFHKVYWNLQTLHSMFLVRYIQRSKVTAVSYHQQHHRPGGRIHRLDMRGWVESSV